MLKESISPSWMSIFGFLTGEGLSWGWVVYFAPSVAEFVTPFLLNHFVLPAANPNTGREISERQALKPQSRCDRAYYGILSSPDFEVVCRSHRGGSC
ncbi:hypothetical protein K503DRAFT_353133 [Rhizopogon vinicolor AM-OR11-026]|uniref:Uncharacterized protein n=1 Tax=Rhizopogon vinicolor AM-OR11-026 TaxID=1314800 RepID=A0A1B7MSW4_9AGAM|nr:hypothetical protein K503DRAFT_353133 [Rhizopogon vinicolor AM-OR11-026]